MHNFIPQNLATTAWAFATVGQPDAQLFMALARAAKRRVGDFIPEELASTAWAFATVGQRDAQLFMALARAVEQRVGDINEQHSRMTLWALSCCESLGDAWSWFAHAKRFATSWGETFCFGALLKECEQRALRDSELALLKAVEGVMSGYDAELAFRRTTKCATGAEQAERGECCAHSMGIYSGEPSG